MQNAFSTRDNEKLRQLVHDYTVPLLAYVHTSPHQRPPQQLPSLIDSAHALQADLESMRIRIDPRLFKQLKTHVIHVLDMLIDVQRQFENLIGGIPPPPYKRWENLPGGGRKAALDEQLIAQLANEGMQDWEIASFFGVCRKTVQRRRKSLGIMKREYVELDDDELQMHVHSIFQSGTGIEGIRAVWHELQRRGIKVPRLRVQTILGNDDRTTWLTRRRPIMRRVYRVPFVNALWHIDGHHKLIRWKIVIHGGMDGYSRMVVFLRAADNNLATTMLDAFLGSQDQKTGVAEFGLPSRVRADYGRENWKVKELMETRRGSDRGSFIQGPSVHNQRIERFWVDMQAWCTKRYRELFQQLEDHGFLDVSDPFQLYSLHFVYLPMLNKSLKEVLDRWNLHGISTAHFNSPRLIWLRNRLQAAQLGIDPIEREDDEMQQNAAFNWHDYGATGRQRRTASSDDDPHVIVEPIYTGIDMRLVDYIHSSDVRYQLELARDEADASGDFGVGQYLRVSARLAELVANMFTAP